jgi:hypothetical protein
MQKKVGVPADFRARINMKEMRGLEESSLSDERRLGCDYSEAASLLL